MYIPETIEEFKKTKFYQTLAHPQREFEKIKKMFGKPEVVAKKTSPLTILFIFCAIIGFFTLAAMTAYLLFRRTSRKYMDIR